MGKINPGTVLKIMRKYKIRRVYISDKGIHLSYTKDAKMYDINQIKAMINNSIS